MGEPTYPKPDISVQAIGLYYRIVAPLMLPFVGGRVLNLFRCVGGRCFYQRNRNHPPSGGAFGPPIRFAAIEQKNGRTEDYLYVRDVAGIIACAEAQAVEFHGWGSLAANVDRPDRLVIDLDPDIALDFDSVKAAARQVRSAFESLRLDSFAMLSGGKGIHVVVPIAPTLDWDEIRGFAKAFCTALAEAKPERFTVALPKPRRKGRIFLDFLRNQRTATAILPYSARARDGAPVAAPVTWEELEGMESAAHFSIGDADELLRRARSAALTGWGQADQALPSLRR
jgi:bifunctional non-homologous end joining protein LigD